MYARTATQESGGSDGFMVIQGRRRKCKSRDTADSAVRPLKQHREVDNSALAGTSLSHTERPPEAKIKILVGRYCNDSVPIVCKINCVNEEQTKEQPNNYDRL